MKSIIISALAVLAVLIVSLIGYIYTTNDIIRAQNKEIAKLRTENFRLQAALKNRSNVRIVEIHDDRIDSENISEFNNI